MSLVTIQDASKWATDYLDKEADQHTLCNMARLKNTAKMVPRLLI